MATKKQTKRRATQARAQATVDTILTGAAYVLEQRGYSGATTDRIAERAGVSVGSIYQYFSNKDEIFEQLFDREASKLFDALEHIFEKSVQSNGHEMVRAWLEAGATQEFLTPKMYDELGRVRSLEAKLQEFSDTLENLTMELIRFARPGLEDAELRTLAELLVATAQGIGRPLRRGDNPALLDAYVEMIDSYVLDARSE